MLSAAGVAEAMANEPEEQRVHTDAELRQQAREGDEVVSATGITSLSALWTNGSQPHEQAAYRLLQEGDRLVPQHEGIEVLALGADAGGELLQELGRQRVHGEQGSTRTRL